MLHALLILIASNPFASCEILGPDSGNDRKLTCSGGRAFVSRDAPYSGRDGLFELMKKGLMKMSRVKETEISVLGSKRRALEYFDGSRTGMIAIVATETDRVRALGCESNNVEWCRQMLDALATSVPEANTKTPGAELGRTLAGKKIEILAKCNEKAIGQIVCSDHSLAWMNHSPGDPESIEDIRVPLMAGLSQMGTVSESARPCSLDGVDTICHVFAVKKLSGSPVHAVVAFGEVRGRKVFAQCNTSAGIDPLPRTCSQILKLK